MIDSPKAPPAPGPEVHPANAPAGKGIIGRWFALPLYVQIVVMMLLGGIVGYMLGPRAGVLKVPSELLLTFLKVIAPPLILAAVMHVLLTTEIQGRQAARMVGLLLINTLMAIFIGLLVANTLKPGLYGVDRAPETLKAITPLGPGEILLSNIPRSLIGPLYENNVIGVIIIALAFGIAGRSIPRRQLLVDVVEMFYSLFVKILHWVIAIVPFGVFAVVASTVGVKGFEAFRSLGAFVIAVLVALSLQTCWYLLRIKFFSWVRPLDALRGVRDALLMAFSTASSTSAMPVTYGCLRNKVGLREKSASMGALVGANFNNDGTALYEAMSALFVAQLVGMDLSLSQQLLVVVTSVVASVGAAGIPEAGIVTMTLVFNAVGLPLDYIMALLTVDWFLDRCRTMVNVLGDVNISCLLDGRTRETPELNVAGSLAVPNAIVVNGQSAAAPGHAVGEPVAVKEPADGP